MIIKNLFTPEVSKEIIERIEALSPTTHPQWGEMSPARMLAHCNVTYDMVFTDKYPKPGAFKKFILKTFVKKYVVSGKAYSRNGKTAPQFIIKGDPNFEEEKNKLVQYIQKTQELGADFFDGKESHSFGVLSKDEWNNMFYKHLDHHLRQFGS